MVCVEDAVFSGNEGVYHVLRKPVDTDDFTLFLARKLRDKLSVDVEDSCRKSRVEFCEIFVVDYVFCI